MKLTLRHTLTFSLGAPAHAAQHVLLTALSTPQQKVERWSIEMPGFAEAVTFRDAFGNRAHLVTQTRDDADVVVVVTGTVETFDRAGVLGRLEFDPMPALFRRQMADAPADPVLTEGLSLDGGRIALLHELMDRVHGTTGAPEQMEAQGSQSQSQGGQSQSQSQSQGASPAVAKPATDLARAFIGAARSLEIPARYVTGYLFDEGTGSFHAWAEAWDEGLGWIGFDPALNVCPADAHIRLASGLDLMSTMPIRSVPVWSEMPVETIELVAD